MLKQKNCFFFFIFFVLAPQNIIAGVMDTYGITSRSSSMGNAGTALKRNGGSTYYNNASLYLNENVDISFGFIHAHTNFPTTKDVILFYDDNRIPQTNDVSHKAPDVLGTYIAISFPIKNFLSLGFLFYTPIQYLISIHLQDPFIPTYALYQNNHQRFNLNFGIGTKPFLGFQFGLGATILASAKAKIDINIAIEDAPIDNNKNDINAQVQPKIFPILSTRWDVGEVIPILKGFITALTYRHKIYLPANIDINVNAIVDVGLGESASFNTNILLPVKINFIDKFIPTQLALGFLYNKPNSPLTITLDLIFMQWSKYQGSYIEIDLESFNIPPLGMLSVNRKELPKNLFRNTVIPRFGFEWILNMEQETSIALRTGYSFELTPIPEQTALTNVLDTDKHIISGGFGVNLLGFNIDLYVQYHQLIPREVKKELQASCDDPNASHQIGYPCSGIITISGNIISTGINFNLDF